MALKDKGHDIDKDSVRPRLLRQQQAPAANAHDHQMDPVTALMRPTSGGPSVLGPAEILTLQRTIGNRAVRGMLGGHHRNGPVTTTVTPPLDSADHRRREIECVVQRTLWKATDTLQWVAVDETGKEKEEEGDVEEEEEPQRTATTPGELFDDATNESFDSQLDYDERDSSAMMISPGKLSEDGLGDPDFVYVEDEDLSSDEEHEAEEEEAPDDPGPELTLDARKEEEKRGLKRPRETSTMAQTTKNYPRTQFTSNVKLKRKGKSTVEQRSAASGVVNITLEAVDLWVNDKKRAYERPVEIVGLVEPTATTGRAGAPDPLSGTQIYMGQKGQLTGSIPAERNMGMPDAERGHIMALELGGPDIPQNILPQWAKFQGSGDWRNMETAVLKAAKAVPHGRALKYRVKVFYKETGEITPTIRSFGVPSGFCATTQICDTKGMPLEQEVEVFNEAQAQDVTDNMLAEREMAKVDGPDWDSSLDVGKATKKRARTEPPVKKAKQTKPPPKRRAGTEPPPKRAKLTKPTPKKRQPSRSRRKATSQ